MLFIQFIIGAGGGFSEELENNITISIKNKEDNHKNCPHVHIQKGNNKDTMVRIRLSDTKIMDGKEKYAHKIYKKDLKRVLKFLDMHKQIFIDNYNLMEKHQEPKNKKLVYENQDYEFRLK